MSSNLPMPLCTICRDLVHPCESIARHAAEQSRASIVASKSISDLPIDHLFHRECFQRWHETAQQGNFLLTCPICRASSEVFGREWVDFDLELKCLENRYDQTQATRLVGLDLDIKDAVRLVSIVLKEGELDLIIEICRRYRFSILERDHAVNSFLCLSANTTQSEESQREAFLRLARFIDWGPISEETRMNVLSVLHDFMTINGSTEQLGIIVENLIGDNQLRVHAWQLWTATSNHDLPLVRKGLAQLDNEAGRSGAIIRAVNIHRIDIVEAILQNGNISQGASSNVIMRIISARNRGIINSHDITMIRQILQAAPMFLRYHRESILYATIREDETLLQALLTNTQMKKYDPIKIEASKIAAQRGSLTCFKIINSDRRFSPFAIALKEGNFALLRECLPSSSQFIAYLIFLWLAFEAINYLCAHSFFTDSI